MHAGRRAFRRGFQFPHRIRAEGELETDLVPAVHANALVPRVRPRSRAWIALGALALGFAAAEFSVRYVQARAAPIPRSAGSLVRADPDPRVRFVNDPGAVQRMFLASAPGASELEIVQRVNEQGFRGRCAAVPKPHGVFRMACLGDSHTFGHGLREGEPWPAVLERELGRPIGSERIEVLNCGVVGYDTEQEVALLERRVLAFEPDLVLLQFYFNDTTMPPLAALRCGDAPPRARSILERLRRNVRCVDLLATKLARLRELGREARGGAPQYAEHHDGWIRCRAALKQARDRLGADGTPFVVVLFPCTMRWGSEFLSCASFTAVRAFCDAESIRCWDISPALAGVASKELCLHPRDLHASARAHALFARDVARRLIDAGLVAPGSEPRETIASDGLGRAPGTGEPAALGSGALR